MKQYLKIGLLALAVIAVTLAVPKKPASSEAKSYTYGYPFPIVRQEKSNTYEPDESVPLEDPRENPTDVVWLNLLIDLVFAYGLLWLIRSQMKKTR